MEELNKENKYCPMCGESNENDSIYCWKCGYNLNQNLNNEELETTENIDKNNSTIKNKSTLIIIVVGLCFTLIFLFFSLLSHLTNEKLYKEANEALKKQELTVAQEKVTFLPDTKKYLCLKTEINNEILYNEANHLFINNDLKNAEQKAKSLPDNKLKYIDLKNKIQAEIKMKLGDEEYSAGNYKKALSFYNLAFNYFKSKSIENKIIKTKNAIKKKAQQLEANLNIYTDNMGNIIYKDRTTIFGGNSMYLYMVKEPNKTPYMYFVISHIGNKTNWNTFKANIDGNYQEFKISEMDKKVETYLFVTSEIVELNYENYKDIINQIIGSRRTIIKLQDIASNKYFSINLDEVDREISPGEKAAMRRMRDYYDLVI